MSKQLSTLHVDSVLHTKMKELAKKNETSITYETEKALRNYIQIEREEEILRDSKIEILINKKMDSIDKHLSSMLANISKDINVLYGAEVTVANKVLNIGNKYSEDELIDFFDKKGEKIYKERMIKARNKKQAKEK